MTFRTVWAAYFSATGTTEKVVGRIAKDLGRLSGAPVETFDFTLPQVRAQAKEFSAGDLVVIGTPVYAGRVPNLLKKYVASLRGNGALAVPVVCYGNRNFDDGLIELRDLLEEGGFHTVAGGAFPCQHAFSMTQAAGRPDVSDLTIAGGFAYSVFRKVSAMADLCPPAPVAGNQPIGPYYTPRDRHGNPINILKVTPKTSDACTKCGLCAKGCPLGSLDPDDPAKLTGPCMKCNHCARFCPVGAKYFDDPNYLYHKTELEALYSFPRKEPELFL